MKKSKVDRKKITKVAIQGACLNELRFYVPPDRKKKYFVSETIFPALVA